MGFFRRRPRFSVSVQIEQLILEECGGRAVRGDGKDLHEFEQLVLKVSGRRSLSSRNKKLAFRLPVLDRDFRKQQVLPFRERFPFQGKLQRRWRRQKPQLIRFRLYGLPRKSKLAPKKTVLLAEFSADLTPHLDRLFELNAPSEALPASAAPIMTPSGPVRAEQPPLSGSRSDHSLVLRMFAKDDSLCVGSHLTVLLDSIHVLKRESSSRRSGEAEGSSDRHRRRDNNQPHRQVELVRTVPLMYRPQTGVGSGVRVLADDLERAMVDMNRNSTDSENSSDSSDSSSSSSDRGARAKRPPRRRKRIAGKTVRVPSYLLCPPEEEEDTARAQTKAKAPMRRQSAVANLLEPRDLESAQSEPNNGEQEQEEEEEMKPPPARFESSDNNVGMDVHDACSASTLLDWQPRKLSSIPDGGDEEEDEDKEEEKDMTSREDCNTLALLHRPKAEDEQDDADDEDDRRSYSFVQGELDHRDAVIAALRAENRAQAALIDQLQAENRRLRAEAACRGPGNALVASMSSTALSSVSRAAALALDAERSVKAEFDSATDSEVAVAKRSASVPLMAPGAANGASGRADGARTAGACRRAARRPSAPPTSEEHVFEGLVQEIQEEFRCLLPAKSGAISTA